MQDRFLTKREVATMLGVTTRTIETWVKEKQIPATVFRTRSRSKVVFQESVIKEWININTLRPEARNESAST